ncbi:PTS glucose transporter subunit IIA [Paludicola sp. MB14-C6]|uniref:PTS sugar transporter subunit IIA n=1 Tax=Paludihabitans sp. MB14-C6 TaxID=3070656 RepID=UPI0027DCDADB|nr:PTS glucose transporter subunit IIA [Paludicola sp. MB14-C6]WMJ22865.1 PTS glucose transporter subunit IIA [Paludicola sp. MB14-C6]
MFEKMKKAFGFSDNKSEEIIYSPVAGEVVDISTVKDPTFSEEILGKGVAIKPSIGKIFAPCNGTISMMFETGHAVSLVSDDGADILIHVGLDTVSLKGQFYKTHVKNDDKVTKGDLLITFDIDGIVNAGYDIITPIVLCNTPHYSKIELLTNQQVKELDKIMILKKDS